MICYVPALMPPACNASFCLPGMNNREVIEKVQMGYRMAKPPRAPDELYKAMLHCWDKDPDQRPTFDFLHHFFDDYQVSSEIPYRDIHD